MRRRERVGEDAQGQPAAPPNMAGFPELWSFVSATKWEEGTVRQPGSVTLFRDQGRLKAAFNDRDAGEVGFLTLDVQEPILAQLEEALREDSVDWRRNGQRGGKGR